MDTIKQPWWHKFLSCSQVLRFIGLSLYDSLFLLVNVKIVIIDDVKLGLEIPKMYHITGPFVNSQCS